jgi:[ribosomal protein S5]-alanine N-acetyltransferase
MISMSRIKLRTLSQSDSEGVFDLLQNTKVMKHIGPKRALTDKEVIDWFKSELDNPTRRVVAFSETNEIIGFCGVKEIDGALDFGYFLREKFWGEGIATEACKMALSNLNGIVDLSKIQIFIADNNKASKNIAKKLNWSKLGREEKDGERGCFYSVSMS